MSDVSLVDSGGGMANTSGGGVIASSQNVRAEWVEYWDESAGASYYYNTVTQVMVGPFHEEVEDCLLKLT